MHSFLRAIGFSQLKDRKDLDRIIGDIMNEPSVKSQAELSPRQKYTEMSKSFGERIGITIRGEYDEMGFFHLEHYFPYCLGQLVSLKECIMVNKRVDTDAYTGMCDDMRLGVSLIFYLQNAVDYLCSRNPAGAPYFSSVALSALSIEGKIILGLDPDDAAEKQRNDITRRHRQLLSEAQSGNQEAIDSLTIEEIDTFAMVNRRIRKEDVYSVVETSFIPYGSESDNYALVGTILNWKIIENVMTGEEIYELVLNCNDLVFNLCINKNDLLGEPMIGRRFKGHVWIQGNVKFS